MRTGPARGTDLALFRERSGEAKAYGRNISMPAPFVSVDCRPTAQANRSGLRMLAGDLTQARQATQANRDLHATPHNAISPKARWRPYTQPDAALACFPLLRWTNSRTGVGLPMRMTWRGKAQNDSPRHEHASPRRGDMTSPVAGPTLLAAPLPHETPRRPAELHPARSA